MREYTALRRQWVLLQALSTRRLGLSVREMARDLDVTDKTVRRDLALFRRVGFSVEEIVGEYGRKTWRIVPAAGRLPLAFTFDEAVALYLGRRLLDPLAGTFFWEAARNAFRKIRAALGGEALAYLDGFAGLFHHTGTGFGDYESKAELIDCLVVAAEDFKTVRLLYRSEGEANATPREVHPYGVVYHRGALYLVGLDAANGHIKHYKVDRIEDAERLGTTFTRPDGFNLEAHMASAFGVYRGGAPVLVKVRFSKVVARYVGEARRHPSQRLTPLPGGGVLAEFTVSGTEEIKRWILGFGAKAFVLEPEELRREILEELRLVLRSYEDAVEEPLASDGSAPV